VIIDVNNLTPGTVIARDVEGQVASFDSDVPMMVVSSMMNEESTECTILGLYMVKVGPPLLKQVIIDRSNIREYRTVLKA